MKYLLLTLLLVGCATKKPAFFQHKEDCMSKFADKGYEAQAVVLICESVLKRRQ